MDHLHEYQLLVNGKTIENGSITSSPLPPRSPLQPNTPLSMSLNQIPLPQDDTGYHVWARDVEFVLSRAQIDFDTPNLFTSAFLNPEYTESTTRVLRIDRHPMLFAIVLEYLSGYEILPLQREALPKTMSLEAGLENLARDAEYYGLMELGRKIARVRESRTSYDLRVFGLARDVVEWDDMQQGKRRFDLGVMDEERTYLRVLLAGQQSPFKYVFLIRNIVLRFRSGGSPYYGTSVGEVLSITFVQAPEGLPLPPRANLDRLTALLSDVQVENFEDKVEVDGVQGSIGALWKTFTGDPWATSPTSNNPFKPVTTLPFRSTEDGRDADYLTLMAEELYVSVDYAEEVEAAGFDTAARMRLSIRYGRFVTMGVVRARSYQAPSVLDL